MIASTVAPRQGLRDLGLAGLFLLLVVAVYADPLFTRRNFGGRDLLGYMMPIESVIHDAYARGRIPVWNSWIAGGRPLMANPNAGALYPVRPLLSPLPFPWALRLFPVLHWALAGAGTIFLLRAIPVSRGAAWIGAVAFVFSGVGVSEVFYTNLEPGVMLFPWILWAFIRRFESRARQAIALASLLGLDFLAGDVFTIAIALSACLLWLLLEFPESERRPAAATLGVSLALAALLALPQIIATLLWVPETNRGVLGMRLAETFLYSPSPFRLLELVIPFPFGETWTIDSKRIWGLPVFQGRPIGFYVTFYAGALAAIALASMGRRRPAGARFARAFFLVSLLVMIPGSLLPASWRMLHSFIPLRYPEKFGVALALALALYSALGFELYRGRERSSRWLLGIGALLAALALAARAFPAQTGWLATALVGGEDTNAPIAAEVLPTALAEAGLFWMVTLVALDLLRRRERAALGISLVLLTCVPIAANRRIARTFRQDALLAPTPFARFVARRDPHGEYRVISAGRYRPASKLEEQQASNDTAHIEFCRRSWLQYTHSVWRLGTIFNDDYDNGDLSRLTSLRNIAFRASNFMDSQAFFGALGLRWAIRFRDQEPPLAGYRRVGGDALMDWDEHENAFPDIRLLRSWREEPGSLSALNVINTLTPGQIVIESGSRVLGSARPGRLRIFEKTPERLRLVAEAPDPTWLFVLRGFWTHREILLDGRPVEDVPAQLAFSAVRVPAGRHAIEWRECVPGGSVSRWGPVLFVLAALLVASSRRLGFLRP